ncbi:hypothetical protein [Streptomyces benahoarensis]|uniref:Uncharacterized protein n=1 Tax=Streptomyces benahoarensis TaxID=2595054 RepID=A0A553ZJF5_9ACTN|nr:hypothetical protein [Streptomyces benahoarensis]TSB31993.1 hypothetical protein FNJ62_03675 [Streptomyces benahoarensis]TSB41583.1 hypothetical protein FNZ23_12305 [Streptomyces benahoarensis]
MNELMQMAGAISDANSLVSQLKDFFLVGVLGLMYVVSIAFVWGQTKSVLKAGVAAIGGAVVLAIVVNMTVLRDKIGEDIKNPSGGTAAPVAVRVVDHIDPLDGGRR